MSLTPVKAIRAYCVKECAGSPGPVRKCEREECPLYLYRMGKNPRRAGIGGKKSHIGAVAGDPREKLASRVRALVEKIIKECRTEPPENGPQERKP